MTFRGIECSKTVPEVLQTTVSSVSTKLLWNSIKVKGIYLPILLLDKSDSLNTCVLKIVHKINFKDMKKVNDKLI